MFFKFDGHNLALLVWLMSVLNGVLASLEKSPKIITKEGNVILEAGINKNITIRLNGRSRLVVNDLDLMELLLGERSWITNATGGQIEGVTLRLLKDDVNTLKTRLFGRGGLSIRLSRLQNRTRMSNPTILFRRYMQKVSVLETKVQNLFRTLKLDNCKTNPCENGGVCINIFDGFFCKCSDGFEGPTCSADVNECALFVGTDIGCQNGAQCINQFGTYTCICNSGWQGVHCSQRKTDCLHSSNLELCGHGTCVNVNDNYGYRCICEQGWKSNGLTPSCSVDVDECKEYSNSCTTKCINLPGGFMCAPCDPGYTGNGLTCRDINECATDNGGCSVNPLAPCINSYGSFHCGECPIGWVGDGRVCTRNTNQQSCALNNICHSAALCQEVSNRIICVCPVGLIGNGVGPNGCYSSGRNMCSSYPCLNGGSCMDNGNGSYTCLCPAGFNLPNCAQRINHCASNPCKNGGTCHSQEEPFPTFTCSCVAGYGGRLCDSQRSRCGQFISSEQGNLKYPLSNLYNHNAQCSWVIRTDESKVLNITFSKFDIEDSVECRFDWLQMHDGPTAASQLIGRFCGSTAPLGGNIITTTNRIYIWFKSDNSTAKAGFDLVWTSIDPVCGGIIVLDSHTTIASPGSPGNYPRNRDCKWNLKASGSRRIKLVFFNLRIEKHSTCNHDFLEISDAISGALLEKFCNSSNPSPLTVPSNDILLHFHSDNEGSDLGFQIHASTVERIPGCGGTYTERNGQIVSPTSFNGLMSCEYFIRYPKGLKIQLQMLKFDMGDNDCIVIYNGFSINKISAGRWCGKMNVPIFRSTDNEVQINYFSTGGTFKMSYGTICEYIFEESSGVITSPNYPNEYPSGETCTYEILGDTSQVVSIDFIDMDLEMHNGISTCWFDYITISDGTNETAAGPYCGNTLPPKIVSSASFLKLTLITDRGNAGRGFKLNYTLINTGNNCGGVMKKSSGEIRLPSDASTGSYSHDLVCIWTIIAPAGYGIQISWLSFQLEYSSDCIYDYVELYDTEKITSEVASSRKYCGSNTPPAIVSATNVLTLKFTSDSTDADDGFVARYNFVDVSSLCGGNLFSATGRIKSPNWPNEYPNDLNCSWSISVQMSHQIELIVKSMVLEESEGCQNDYLEIRNGGSNSSPLIGKYCGQIIPTRIPSFTHQIYVHFTTNAQLSKAGFEIEWQTVSSGCGGVLSADHGSVASPHYPLYYNNDAQCEWRISVNKGSTISMTFDDLSLETLFSCSYDFVEVYDGPTTDKRKIGRYCEKPIDSSFQIETTGSDALIRFQSDSSNTDRGFYLNYVSNCNQILNATYGAIESPTYGDNNPSDVNCTWTIRAPKGNRIVLDFAIVGRKDGYSNPDYVYFKEANNNTVTRIAKPRRIESQNNTVQVWLNSTSIYFRMEYELRGCVETLRRPSGKFSSPGYPNAYPSDFNCIWFIETEIGMAIEIVFTNVDIENTVNCTNDAIQVWNTQDKKHLLANLCGKLDNITISSTGHTAFVEFYSGISINGKGFKANYRTFESKCGGKYSLAVGTILSPNYPENYGSNLHCEWLIQVSDHSTMTLTIEELDLENSSMCAMDGLTIYDGNVSENNQRVICGNEIPTPNFIKTTSNTAMLVFETDSDTEFKGFKVSFKENCGKRIIIEDTGRIRFSGSDQEQCLWVLTAEDMSKHVTFTTTHVETVAGWYTFGSTANECYGINIYDGDYTNTTGIRPKQKFCSRHPPASTSLGHALTISLNSTTIAKFEGFYSIMDNNCGGQLNSLHGTLASPSYPIAYPVNIECIWEIGASNGNSLILTIQSMDIDKTDSCNDDYLEVREGGGTGRLIGVFCGDEVPSPLTAFKSFWIKFNSDNDFVRKGFIAEYSYALHTELNGTTGILESPRYPELFLNTIDYTWRITVPRGDLIMLSFEYFLPKYETNTKFYNGYDSQAEPIEYTGANILRSDTNILYIKSSGGIFKLRWYMVSKEFMATNKTSVEEHPTCYNKIISSTNNPTVIESPGYPEGYDSNLNCSWIIVPTDPGSHAVISFVRIDLEDYGNCAADHIILYSSIDLINWNRLDKICKLKSDTIFKVLSDKFMKVEFISDFGVNKTGFTATAYSLCGSTLTDSSGFISTANYTNGLTSLQMFCIWKIKVKVGRRIKITFVESQLRNESSDQCRTYVLLKNGISEHSPNLGIGKYCDSNIVDIPITSSNAAYVKFNFERMAFVGPKISFKYEEVINECSKNINLDDEHSSVIIQSENYPNIPHPHTMCVWIFRAPINRLIAVNFIAPMSLKENVFCDSEYVELNDGSTNLSPVIARICGSSIPNTQYSSGNLLRITYFTDIAEPNIGFKANISLGICGGTYQELNGTISSPRALGASAMKTNFSCDYSISLPESSSINLTINAVNLPWSENCSEVNHLRITSLKAEGDPNTEDIVICGTHAHVNYLLYVNKIRISYQIKNTELELNNFKISYSAIGHQCGQTLEAESGTLKSPGYLSALTLPTRCIWKLKVPKGRRIKIEFLEYNMAEPVFHQNSSIPVGFRIPNRLVLSNGFEFQSIIARIYGNPPAVLYSTDNLMTVLSIETPTTQKKGFKLRFSSEEESIFCNDNFDAVEGEIHFSPPQNTSVSCHYDINVRPNETIALTINKIETGPEIFRDTYYCMRNTPLSLKSLSENIYIHWFCGNRNETTIRLPFPVIFHMSANIYNKMSSLDLKYSRHNCGGVFNIGNQFQLTAPKIQNMNYGSIDCAWRVLPNPADFDQFEVTLSVDFRLKCDEQYLILYSDSKENSPHLGRFCNQATASNLTTTKDLLIEYHSSSYEIESTFNLTATVGTGCGGELTYPFRLINFRKQYQNNVECIWTIRTGNKYHISLKFTGRFFIESSVNCTKDYILVQEQVVTNGENEWSNIQRICGREPPALINTKTNEMRFIFRSDDSGLGDGFTASFERSCGGVFYATQNIQSLSSPNYPSPYDYNLTCNYTILPTEPNKSILLQIMDFMLENSPTGNCDFDNLTVYVGNHDPVVLCGSNHKEEFRSSKSITLVFKTDNSYNRKGYLLQYGIEKCGGNITSSTAIATPKQQANSMYPVNTECIWNITADEGYKIIIKFERFVFEGSMACSYDYVQIFAGKFLTDEQRVAKLCGNLTGQLPPLSIKSNTGIIQSVSDESEPSLGFSALVLLVKNCDKDIELKDVSDTYKLDDFATGYANNLDCRIMIKTAPGNQLLLEFSDFHLEDSKDCNNDYVQIRDGGGPFADEIGKFCGHIIPNSVFSSRSTMYVHFVSDTSETSSGFSATIKVVPLQCGSHELFIKTNESIIVESKGENYQPNLNCFWRLRSDTNIRLDFVKLDIEGPDENGTCKTDYLKIYKKQPFEVTENELGTDTLFNGFEDQNYGSMQDTEHIFCGHGAPSGYYTNNPEIFIKFFTDSSIEKSGFKIIATSTNGCYKNYTTTQGRIFMDTAADCNIYINAPQNYSISVYFNYMYFFFGDTEICDSNFIEVFDERVNSTKPEKLRKICGSVDPSNSVFTDSNRLRILLSHNGFFSNYDLTFLASDKGPGCGGDLYNVAGVFTSPFYPENARNNSDCRWNIRVPNNMVVALKFKIFDLGSKVTCHSDYLQILEQESGPNGSSGKTDSIARQFCGEDTPTTYVGHRNTLSIRFRKTVNFDGTGWVIVFSGVRQKYSLI